MQAINIKTAEPPERIWVCSCGVENSSDYREDLDRCNECRRWADFGAIVSAPEYSAASGQADLILRTCARS